MTGLATFESFAMSWNGQRFCAKARSSTPAIWPCRQVTNRLRSDTTDLGVVERTTIANVLQECRGNKTRAARRLGLSRTQLHLRIRKYRLEEAASA